MFFGWCGGGRGVHGGAARRCSVLLVGTAAEGMAAGYRLGEAERRRADLRPDMVERVACSAGTMVQRQVGAVEAAEEPDPGLAAGAWFYRSYTQVDDQQHVLSGLLGAEQAMRGRNQ